MKWFGTIQDAPTRAAIIAGRHKILAWLKSDPDRPLQAAVPDKGDWVQQTLYADEVVPGVLVVAENIRINEMQPGDWTSPCVYYDMHTERIYFPGSYSIFADEDDNRGNMPFLAQATYLATDKYIGMQKKPDFIDIVPGGRAAFEEGYRDKAEVKHWLCAGPRNTIWCADNPFPTDWSLLGIRAEARAFGNIDEVAEAIVRNSIARTGKWVCRALGTKAKYEKKLRKMQKKRGR